MYTDQTDLLARFHQVLIEHARSREAGGASVSLNVGDIYYEVAPFHSCGRRLGVDSIFEYERALIRLLAGEGGYLQVESLADRQKLERQIDLRSPDPTTLRDYLSVGVRICDPGLEESVGEHGEAEPPPIQECPSCTEALPQQDGVRFCPFCGDDVRRTPCLSCGESLRLDWRFCTACGGQAGLGTGSPTAH